MLIAFDDFELSDRPTKRKPVGMRACESRDAKSVNSNRGLKLILAEIDFDWTEPELSVLCW